MEGKSFLTDILVAWYILGALPAHTTTLNFTQHSVTNSLLNKVLVQEINSNVEQFPNLAYVLSKSVFTLNFVSEYIFS